MNPELITGFVVELIKAITIGFCVAAPVGPCGFLCISRSMKDGFRSGVATGLGVTLADTLYAAIGAFGISATIHLLDHWKAPLQIAGGLFLIVLGARIAFTQPDITPTTSAKEELHGAFASAFLLTLANPLTIFTFIFLFAGLGVAGSAAEAGIWHAVLLVAGVAIGSFTWWVFLSWLSSHFGRRVNPAVIGYASRLLGWVLVVFGLFALWTVTNSHFGWFPGK